MRTVNLTICLICASVLLMIIAGTYAIDTGDNRTSSATVSIMKSNFLFNVLCFFTILLDGNKGPLPEMIRVMMRLSFFLVLFYFVEYVYSYTSPDEDPRRKLVIPFLAGTVGFLTMSIAGFLGSYASFKSVLNNIGILCSLSLPLIAGYAVYRNKDKLNRGNLVAFTSYTAIGFASILLQYTFPDIRIINAGLMLSSLLIYVVLSMRRYLLISEQKQQLSEARMKMLQMQMNPHFLSNTMNTIYHLCEKDAKQAMQGIDNLSGFLRNNLDLSAGKELIPFEKELESIRYYYSLEQMRRPGKLKIVYMIETEDFLVPPFSIQVFAENAVKHGFNEGKGETVSLSVREQNGKVEINIIDDGTGFETENLDSENNSGHYGITNAQERIKTLLNGDVSLISSPETGTIVIINIPVRKTEDMV